MEEGEEATSGIQELEDDATAKDAELTSITTAYEATRAAYANSTAAIVTLGEELKTAKAARSRLRRARQGPRHGGDRQEDRGRPLEAGARVERQDAG